MTLGPYNVLSGPYAQKLDKTMRQLWGQGDGPPKTERRESLFYQIRPFYLLYDYWFRESHDNFWKRKAYPVGFDDATPNSYHLLTEFPGETDSRWTLYFPHFSFPLSARPVTRHVWAVYRGRWEVLSWTEKPCDLCFGTVESDFTKSNDVNTFEVGMESCNVSNTHTSQNIVCRADLLRNGDTLRAGDRVCYLRTPELIQSDDGLTLTESESFVFVSNRRGLFVEEKSS